MYHRIAPRIHVLRAAAQKGPSHVRTLSMANMRPDPTRPTANPGEGSRWKMGLDREKLYIGGGLVAIGAIWYYYATVENARIERKRGGSTTGSAEQAVEGASRSVKDRTKEALKSAQ